MKYKLLILDYGGTYSFDYKVDSFNTIMEQSFGRTPNVPEKEAINRLSTILAAGTMTSGDYVNEVAKLLHVKTPNLRMFEDITISVTHDPSAVMEQLVAKVRKSGVRVSLLSNMYLFEIERTMAWGRFDGFDYTSFSAQAKLTKADPAFFHLTLDHFEVDPADTLFVDDIAEYTEVAKSLGIHTIHVDKNAYNDARALADAIEHELSI